MIASSVFFSVVWLSLIIVVVTAVAAGIWKAFRKAGQPGWAVLIPIFNYYVLLKVAGKPWWWLILLIIPIVNIIILILVAIAVAARFGKEGGFAVGLIFLPFIFYPILGFGDAQYLPPPAAA